MTATGETMADTEKDTTNEVVPEKAVIVTNPETLESNNRIEKMKKLMGTLKGKKAAMTREYKKLGPFSRRLEIRIHHLLYYRQEQRM